MIITIGKPCAITEKGGRSNNEDSIYPLPEQVTLDQKLFMVCDGVRVHTNFLFYVPKG